MLNQKSLNFTKTTNHKEISQSNHKEISQSNHKEISQLIKKDFKNIENNNDNKNNFLVIASDNNSDIKELKRKIDSIIKYQKPYISKQFYEVLKQNSSNAKILYDFIISEQNEINNKDSTKETKIKRIVNLLEELGEDFSIKKA
jgi:hypothetical protein